MITRTGPPCSTGSGAPSAASTRSEGPAARARSWKGEPAQLPLVMNNNNFAKASATLLTVVTPRATYENMGIENLSSTDDVKTGEAIRFVAQLKQVRLVARISKTGSAQKQADDFQVELPGVKTGVQGVVLDITDR